MCCAAPTADNVVKFLPDLKTLFGLPRAIRSDQGTAFTAQQVRIWCTKHGVAQNFTPVGDHRGSGLVERTIRTVRSRVGTAQLADPQTPYPRVLHKVLWDLRISRHATTQQSPFFRLFGRDPNTTFSNFSYVLDSRRLLKKGNWHQTEIASPNLLTDRDSESDTDPEDIPPTKSRKPATSAADNSDDESAVEVVDLTSPAQSPSRPVAAPTNSPAPGVNPHHTNVDKTGKSATRFKIYMKGRPSAKAGTNNFVNISHLVAAESPHTYTLSNGKVIRKIFTRICLDNPRPGTFGTPSRLQYHRVFVSPRAEAAYQSSLSVAARQSRRRRQRHMENRNARPQTPQRLRNQPTRFEVADTPSPEVTTPPQAVRRSNRQRKAVVVPGATRTPRPAPKRTLWIKPEPHGVATPSTPRPNMPHATSDNSHHGPAADVATVISICLVQRCSPQMLLSETSHPSPIHPPTGVHASLGPPTGSTHYATAGGIGPYSALRVPLGSTARCDGPMVSIGNVGNSRTL